MKKIKLATIMAPLALALIFSSCKKDDASVEANSSSSLTAGRSGIVFNTNTAFVTNTAFDVRNAVSSTAQSFTNSGTRVIVLTAIELNGSSAVRHATVSLTLPATSSTSSGNIVASFSAPTPALVAVVSLSSDSGTTSGAEYDSQSGTLTVTKLSSTEIEGTFNGTVSDGTTSYIISNGSFAGKF